MPSQIQRIRILLSSPGNLSSDRLAVQEVAKQINNDSGRRDGFHIEVVTWETHTRPAIGQESQAVINEQFPKDIDIYVGLLGVYFGKPTKKWRSGTEEEFRLAYESWKATSSPEIMFYFSDSDVSPNEIDASQLQMCKEFRHEISELGVRYEKYFNLADFKIELLRHLSGAVYEVLKNGPQNGDLTEPQEQLHAQLPNYERLRNDYPEIAVEDLLNDGAYHLEEHTKEMERLTEDIERFSRNLNKFTHQLKRSGSDDRRIEVLGRINNEVENYQAKLKERIPIMRNNMEIGLVSTQRAANIVKISELSNQYQNQMNKLTPALNGMREAVSQLRPVVIDANEEVENWPRDGEFGHHKLRLIALHEDFLAYVDNTLRLIDKTAEHFS